MGVKDYILYIRKEKHTPTHSHTHKKKKKEGAKESNTCSLKETKETVGYLTVVCITINGKHTHRTEKREGTEKMNQ